MVASCLLILNLKKLLSQMLQMCKKKNILISKKCPGIQVHYTRKLASIAIYIKA